MRAENSTQQKQHKGRHVFFKRDEKNRHSDETLQAEHFVQTN